MPKVTVTINRRLLNQQLEQAIELTTIRFKQECDLAITSSVWVYPFPPSPRDIVDQGALLRSGHIRKINAREREVVWDVPYALDVHEGVSLPNGTKLPPRRWTRYALGRFDIYQYFRGVYEQQQRASASVQYAAG